MKKMFPATAVMTCLLLGWTAASTAATEPLPPGNPMLPQLAEMGGAMQAGADLCDMGQDIVTPRSQQQEQFIQMGGTSEQFDTSYQAGYDQAKSKFEAADASEREGMCEGFRSSVAAQQGGG